MATEIQGMTTTLQPTTALPSALTSTYLRAGTSDNTRKAYQSDIRHFMSHGGLLPATTEMILAYLHAEATLRNPRTLKRRLTALRHWHTYQGFPDPTQNPLITKMLTGIMRVQGKPAHKAKALTLEELQQMSQFLLARGELSDYRDNLLLQLGFFGAFRRSELVGLQWEHISFVPEGVTILIPRSKTDQTGEGTQCAIPYGHDKLCPVKALQLWKEHSGLATGAVLRSITKGKKISNTALTTGSVNTIIKAMATDCNLANPPEYSGHSLRRGFASEASKANINMASIMRQGRWRSEHTVAGYIAEGKQFQNNAADELLKNLGRL